MASQNERPPKRPFFARKSRHPRGRESRPQPAPAPADKKATSGLPEDVEARKDLWAFLGKFAIPLGISVLFVCLAIWLFTGYVVGRFSPEYMVTVQPFEIAPAISSSSSLTGKSASDLVVDILNDATSHAAQFHGTDYYKYAGAGAQPVSLHHAIKIPVQTSYGIELKGISVDGIFQLYDRVRYDQWIISGDVVSSPDGLVARIRLNHDDAARSWETRPRAHATPSELVRDASYLMLARELPELLGQSYLQQGKYGAAEDVFRQWALDDPRNWKPSYYLSLAYSYEDKGQEASSLANWSNKIAGNRTSEDFRQSGKFTRPEREISSDLAQITNIALETNETSDIQRLNGLQQTLNNLGQGHSSLAHLLGRSGGNVDYQIQRARVLDKEALIVSDRDPDKASQLSREAIHTLDDAIQSVPENGGLHEQRAILLMHLVTIMKKQAGTLADIRAKESEEAREYTRALELRPTEDSALWGAVYAEVDLGNHEDAIDLARTITLLEPDSKAANTAYIVALERAIRTPENEREREAEVKDRVKRLLQSDPDESQVLAIWDAFMRNNDREGLDLVTAGAKRLFPGMSSFDERMLRGYSAALLPHDYQTGS